VGRRGSEQRAYFGNALSARDPEGARDLYRKAAMRFESIAREGGVRNGRLYYNIGNTYFRMGDVGRAILNYRRAEALIPNDANLRQNLTYARKRRLDRIDEKERTRVLKTLFFWHYDLASNTRLAVFAAAFGLFWVCAGVRLFVARALVNALLVLSGVLWLLFFASLVAEEVGAARNVAGVIVADEAVARKGDGETYQPSFEEPLHAGTEFVLVEARRQWYHIELADGRRCWIPRTTAELVR